MTGMGRPTAWLALAVGIICGLASQPRAADKTSIEQNGPPVEDQQKKSGLTIDVVLESIDLEANTLSVKAYHHVIPPTEKAGGSVNVGNTPAGVKETRYERLPVMPAAGMKDLKLRSGMHVILRLDTIKGGAVAVVEVTVPTEPERIGVDWLDAATAKGGRK
jgi:hypothetical protein